MRAGTNSGQPRTAYRRKPLWEPRVLRVGALRGDSADSRFRLGRLARGRTLSRGSPRSRDDGEFKEDREQRDRRGRSLGGDLDNRRSRAEGENCGTKGDGTKLVMWCGVLKTGERRGQGATRPRPSFGTRSTQSPGFLEIVEPPRLQGNSGQRPNL